MNRILDAIAPQFHFIPPSFDAAIPSHLSHCLPNILLSFVPSSRPLEVMSLFSSLSLWDIQQIAF
jgi:hypothetical protein